MADLAFSVPFFPPDGPTRGTPPTTPSLRHFSVPSGTLPRSLPNRGFDLPGLTQNLLLANPPECTHGPFGGGGWREPLNSGPWPLLRHARCKSHRLTSGTKKSLLWCPDPHNPTPKRSPHNCWLPHTQKQGAISECNSFSIKKSCAHTVNNPKVQNVENDRHTSFPPPPSTAQGQRPPTNNVCTSRKA